MKVINMKALVAIDKNRAIGLKGGMLFHLPTDLAHFKKNTLGKTIVIGRNTLLSFPGGKTLPGRNNVVLSRTMEPGETELKNGYKLFMLLDARPVGIVSVKESLIEDLYVLPEKQNKGFGSALLEFACAKCAGTPTLWILENNVNAARLYRRMGFTETGRRNIVATGLDEIEFAR